MFVLFWSNICDRYLFKIHCFSWLILLVDFIITMFSHQSDQFVTDFWNSEINQSQSSNIFMYIITDVKHLSRIIIIRTHWLIMFKLIGQ